MKNEPHCKLQKNDKETDIELTINLDGTGKKLRLTPGIPFYDHMLDGFAVMDF